MAGLTFKTKAAQMVYSDYMLRIEKNITALSMVERNEMIMEFNSHIYEATVNATEADETISLLDVLNKLGAPEEFLKPLVAQKKLNQAVRTFNPKDVFQALWLNINNGLIYSVFGLMYLFLTAFVFLAGAKLFFPANTGLFYENTNFRGFGFINNPAGYSEVLGYWIIPLSLITAVCLYFGITMLIRLTRRQ